jgi:hypothetical protein
MRKHVGKVAITALGWVLLLAGLAALVLPGPGLLLLASGLVVLSQEYDWARRRLEPVEAKAWQVAREGVQTVPRILLSAVGALALIVIGLIWGWSPTIPRWWIFGPQLPFAGWGVAATLIVSGLVAAVLLVYSIRRFRAPVAQGRPDPTD